MVSFSARSSRGRFVAISLAFKTTVAHWMMESHVSLVRVAGQPMAKLRRFLDEQESGFHARIPRER